ncbi:AAEL014833-PA [Aedes aegypti]|uniref:Uncharacterized protein n=2 Tax=Aedes aegypti TaxID=7159 RepID=Q16FB3_AEDAE|nr:uncharacterized protein LOC5569611 [Aedes aegypti]EAT32930.1 AAEL014833-PA [Aedes aegypti]
MMKCLIILAVLCVLCAGYSIPMQNGFMYYQQPMAYRVAHRTAHGVHYQNQQLQENDAEVPVQDPYVEPAAYPSEQFPADVEPQFDVPAVHEIEADVPLADVEPVAAPAVPATVNAPEKKKKKVPVKVDSDEEQDAQVGRRSSDGAAAPSVYFPLNFGNTKGGAIAVANSYSTGKDGSATSTATAYGSPATAELRRTAPVQLKKKPAKLRARQN